MNFSILKKILACAHFRVRALRIFYHLCQKTMIFKFSQRCEIRRAPQAEVRARQKFFWKCNLHDKISLQIFLFGHNSKSEFFRAIWSLKFFFENSIFSKKFGFGWFFNVLWTGRTDSPPSTFFFSINLKYQKNVVIFYFWILWDQISFQLVLFEHRRSSDKNRTCSKKSLFFSDRFPPPTQHFFGKVKPHKMKLEFGVLLEFGSIWELQ